MNKNQQEIILTVGLFFDGTGNNAINVGNMLDDCKNDNFNVYSLEAKTLLGQHAVTHKKLMGNHALSYTNYYSNVYWLSYLYKQTYSAPNNYFQKSLYIQGIGTESEKPDSLLGSALGVAGTGIIAKTDVAINMISLAIQQEIVAIKKVLATDNFIIKSLQFDIFGFSRGAASARHFSNRVFNKDPALIQAVKGGVGCLEYHGEPCGKTRFIGIFDTVTAIGEVANGLNPHSSNTGSVDIRLRPGVAEKVFHITAQHECRFNFALNSVQPSWPELTLPGSHSDIGGGYLPLEKENVFLTRPYSQPVNKQQLDSETRVYRQTLAQRKTIESAPTLTPILRNQKVLVESWSKISYQRDRYNNEQKFSFSALALPERIIKNDWSRVVLRVMVDAAKKAGVLFDPISDTQQELLLPPELTPLLSKALAMGDAVWHGQKNAEFSNDELTLLGKDYLHCSANWNEVMVDAQGAHFGESAVTEIIGFTNRPDEHWKRTCYGMDGIRQPSAEKTKKA